MRLLLAVVMLAGITSAGVLVLMPKGTVPVPVTQDGDVRDFGFGRASPVLAAPRLPPVGDAVPDHLRLRFNDGRCLGGGLLSTALVAGGWCGELDGEEHPADAERRERVPEASPVHPAGAPRPRAPAVRTDLRQPA